MENIIAMVVIDAVCKVILGLPGINIDTEVWIFIITIYIRTDFLGLDMELLFSFCCLHE